jgi:hypothetical protein
MFVTCSGVVLVLLLLLLQGCSAAPPPASHLQRCLLIARAGDEADGLAPLAVVTHSCHQDLATALADLQQPGNDTRLTSTAVYATPSWLACKSLGQSLVFQGFGCAEKLADTAG